MGMYDRQLPGLYSPIGEGEGVKKEAAVGHTCTVRRRRGQIGAEPPPPPPPHRQRTSQIAGGHTILLGEGRRVGKNGDVWLSRKMSG
jgi:hypothetical protein